LASLKILVADPALLRADYLFLRTWSKKISEFKILIINYQYQLIPYIFNSYDDGILIASFNSDFLWMKIIPGG